MSTLMLVGAAIGLVCANIIMLCVKHYLTQYLGEGDHYHGNGRD